MKKILSAEQVKENIQAKYPNISPEVKLVKGMYFMVIGTAEVIVTKTKCYQRSLTVPVEKVAFEYDGNGYAIKDNKEEADFLLTVCGFKKAAVPGAALTLKQKIEALPRHIKMNIKVNDVARFVRQYSEYTESLLSSFSNAKITLRTNTDGSQELTFKYYTGQGKTFKEGTGKIMITELENLILIPELEAIAAKYGKTISKPNLLIAA